MPIFAYLFFGIVILFLGGGWIVSGATLLLARKRKWNGLKWFSGAAFACFSLVIALGIAGVSYGRYRSSTPRLVFEDTFGKSPPAGMVVLHGSSGGFADSAYVEVAFRTDRETFHQLRPSKLDRISLETYQSYLTDRPRWWRNPGPKTEIWMKDSGWNTLQKDPGQSFGSEWTFMTWDEDGLVQYSWEGID